MVQNDIFLFFIIVILIAIVVGIKLAITIIHSIPFMGMGYTTPAITASSATTEMRERSGFGGTLLLLIIIAAIFWLLLTNSQHTINSAPPSTIPETEQEQTPSQQGKISLLPSKTDITSNYIGTPTLRVNQKPTRPNNSNGGYAIQVAALKTHAKAVTVVSKLNMYRTSIIHDYDGLYKVWIVEFPTWDAANQYKELHDLDGFIRNLNDSTPTRH